MCTWCAPPPPPTPLPPGVLCICEVWRQQPGLLHDTEQKLHHELVKERRPRAACGGPAGFAGRECIRKVHAHKSQQFSIFLFQFAFTHIDGMHQRHKQTHTRTNKHSCRAAHTDTSVPPSNTGSHNHETHSSRTVSIKDPLKTFPPKTSRGGKKKQQRSQASNVNTIY